MAMMLQLILTLCTLISVTGSRDVVRSVGSSVELDIQPPVPKFKQLFWMFNRTNRILEYNKKHKDVDPSSRYKDRLEFNEGTYSLTLKNLQKNDSGVYEARAAGDKVVAEYSLSVLDPVEAPVLTLQLRRDICNITLICRGHKYTIDSGCYKKTCRKKILKSSSITISLSVRGSSIICNQSNSVSWKEDVLEMGELQRLCADGGSVSPPAGVSVCVLKTGLYSITLILMLSAVITVHIRARRTRSS